MDFEEQFIRTLREAGESYTIEARPVLERSLHSGRVRRARRIAGAVSASTAAVALTVAGVALSAPASRPPSATAPAPATASRSGPWIVDQLQKLVPPGSFSDEVGMGAGGGRPYTQPASAQMVYDDGHGAAHLGLTVTLGDGDSQPGLSSCPAHLKAPLVHCEESRLPDGSTILVAESTLGSAHHLQWTATLTTRNIDQIRLDEVNSSAEKASSPVTRATPPLSAAQLSAVVADPAWSQVLAALHPARPDGQPSQAQVIAIARRLQPAGFRFGANNTEDNEGMAGFPISKDGAAGGNAAGAAVEVEVQHWPTGTVAEIKAEAFASATRLSDGTLLLVTHQQVFPMAFWEVSVLRPDGTVVRLSETGPVRDKDSPPLLPLAQLKDMALSPLWTG